MSDDEVLLIESYRENTSNSLDNEKQKENKYTDLTNYGWYIFKFKISNNQSKSLHYIFTAPGTPNSFTAKTARGQQKRLNQEIVNILFEF